MVISIWKLWITSPSVLEGPSLLVRLLLNHCRSSEAHLARTVREAKLETRSAAILTWFFPIGGCAEQRVTGWIAELPDVHQWCDEDPVFPATEVSLNPDNQFAAIGLLRSTWSNADPVRRIFRAAFESAGLPYFNPHSFRKTLARFGEKFATPLERLAQRLHRLLLGFKAEAGAALSVGVHAGVKQRHGTCQQPFTSV